jgi:peptide/nickel transport system permease protein
MAFGSMLGGTVLIESVFSMPGLGYLTVSAIRQKDIPVVIGTVTFLAVLFYLIMFLIDIVYAFIDPRIKAQYEK